MKSLSVPLQLFEAVSKGWRATIWIDQVCAVVEGPHKPHGSSWTSPQHPCWGCGLDAMSWPAPCSCELSLQQRPLLSMTVSATQTYPHAQFENYDHAFAMSLLTENTQYLNLSAFSESWDRSPAMPLFLSLCTVWAVFPAPSSKHLHSNPLQ